VKSRKRRTFASPSHECDTSWSSLPALRNMPSSVAFTRDFRSPCVQRVASRDETTRQMLTPVLFRSNSAVQRVYSNNHCIAREAHVASLCRQASCWSEPLLAAAFDCDASECGARDEPRVLEEKSRCSVALEHKLLRREWCVSRRATSRPRLSARVAWVEEFHRCLKGGTRSARKARVSTPFGSRPASGAKRYRPADPARYRTCRRMAPAVTFTWARVGARASAHYMRRDIPSLHTASLFRTRMAHERQASSPSIAGADNWEGEHEALFDPVAPVGRHLLPIRSRVISHGPAHQACMQPGALGALHSAWGHCEGPQNRVRTYRHGDDAAVRAADKVMHVVRDRLGCRHGLFRCTYR
jgi:hypothetical protein